MKREVRVQDAVGMVLAHDMTRIVPGEYKGVAFHRGHVIAQADVEELLTMGKAHVFVLDMAEDEVHEDDAAARMATALVAEGLTASAAHEGKVTLAAVRAGLFKVNVEALAGINGIGDIAVVTRMSYTPVSVGQAVASVRAIPLVLPEARLQTFEAMVRTAGPIFQLLPYAKPSVGVVTTGSEVLSGRVQDRFGPAVRRRTEQYGLPWLGQRIVGDGLAEIASAIREFVALGAGLVLVTGGMSVDPDDRSPAAIREVADEVVTYGMPILPGSMTMLAYAGDATLMGLPGAVMHDAVTAFDILLPRLLAGERPTRDDIARMGHGGLLTR
ncbi:MAG: molybdopterin-binding protein [Firmicutes bacterium]|nr:molybdopterin-binding protein [Bacillota bacterium]